ncbi:MAG: four-helix bundle copper-binding protein [Gallionella sp.]
MNRRELLTNAAAMVAAVTAGRAFAAEHDHMQHDHEQKPNKYQMLLVSASDCMLKADICLQHCIVAMGKGDKDLAACARSSSEVAAICIALQHLASADSKQLPQLAKVAMDICKDCEDECKKTDKQPECRACGEACAECYKECKKISV